MRVHRDDGRGPPPQADNRTVIINISFPGISASSFSMSGVTTADSAARANWIGCEPNARTSAVPRMRKVDIATPFRLILRKRDLMFACLLQLTSEMRSTV